MTMLSAMSFLTSSTGEDMSGTVGGGKDGGESGTVARDKTVWSVAADVAVRAGEAGERMKRRTRASPVNAANVMTSERVVSFIQHRYEK